MKKTILLIGLLFICGSAFAGFNSDLDNLTSTGVVKVCAVDNMQMNINYDLTGSGIILYEGIAVAGTLSTSGNWLVRKYYYDDSDYTSSPSAIRCAEGKWSDRTTLTYAN